MQTRSLTPFLLLLGLTSASCYAAEISDLKTQVSELTKQLAFQAEQREDLATKLDQLNSYWENKIREVFSKISCTDSRVADFLAECESGSDVCSPKGGENALFFLHTQEYATQYLDPVLGAKSMTLIRKGHLGFITEPKKMLPSTRFLIMAQPRAEGEQANKEALEVGRSVLKFIRSENMIDRSHRILGPKLLPCKIKAEKLSQYVGRLDRVQVGEPTDPKQRVRVWVIKTDC